jgi:hypothetical protein
MNPWRLVQYALVYDNNDNNSYFQDTDLIYDKLV